MIVFPVKGAFIIYGRRGGGTYSHEGVANFFKDILMGVVIFLMYYSCIFSRKLHYMYYKSVF